MFRVGGQAGTISVTLDVDADGAGAVSESVDDAERFMLMMCHRPDARYDPDAQDWTSADYRYSIEWDVPPPTVTSVTPAEIERGSHGVTLVHGTGFSDEPGLDVAASGTKLNLELSEFVSPTELTVGAVVAPDAELGARDVTVTNPNGDQAVGVGLLTVVEPSPPEPLHRRTTRAAAVGWPVGARPAPSPFGLARSSAPGLGVPRATAVVAPGS